MQSKLASNCQKHRHRKAAVADNACRQAVQSEVCACVLIRQGPNRLNQLHNCRNSSLLLCQLPVCHADACIAQTGVWNSQCSTAACQTHMLQAAFRSSSQQADQAHPHYAAQPQEQVWQSVTVQKQLHCDCWLVTSLQRCNDAAWALHACICVVNGCTNTHAQQHGVDGTATVLNQCHHILFSISSLHCLSLSLCYLRCFCHMQACRLMQQQQQRCRRSCRRRGSSTR